MRRFASTLVLAPTAIAVTYIGGWLFLGLCTLAAAIILWEWTSVVFRGADPRIFVPGVAALLVAMALTREARPDAAIAILAIGAALAGVLVVAWPRRSLGSNQAGWAAGGVVYAGVTLLAPALLRADPQWGFVALIFLFAIVWATDIFAYLVGRLIGGPLLWPAVSPKKTWSGAVGGLVGGVAAGTAVAYASVGMPPAVAVALASVLSIVAQGGDLFESAVKRRFGAKDASGLIPGHGGLMDRLDGFLVTALVAVLIGSLHQGMATPAHGLLIW
ncbi:MAG: phosphatidate cytidylyltransferase [Xanthobacteraceae bacterium]